MIWKKGFALLTGALVAIGMIGNAEAATKKSAGSSSSSKSMEDTQTISNDPGSATIHENKLLKWGPVNPPLRAKKPEFSFRGAVLSVVKAENAEKNVYDVKILPIEVVDNENRFITFENFKNGVELHLSLNKDQLKNLQKGEVVEYRQWYETVDQGGQGYARMIGFIFHSSIAPYQTSALAYLQQGGLQPEQYLNAVKAVHVSSGKGSENVKDILDALASSSKVPEVKSEAGELLVAVYGAQPTGKSLPTANGEAPVSMKKKK